MGADTQIALRDLAISWCRARSDLANEWLDRFQERRGLVTGGKLEQARLVENLSVNARSGRVTLRWDAPAEGCDSVKIIRAPDPAGESSDEAVIYEGSEPGFVDTSVKAKQHYSYRVFSVSSGRTSLRSEQISTRRKASNRKLAVPFAAFVLIALAGVVGWDLQRETSLLRSLGDAPSNIATERPKSTFSPGSGFGPVREPETDVTPAPATDAESIERAEQLAEKLAAGDHERLANATPRDPDPDAAANAAVAPDQVERDPPKASVRDSPTLAFSGQTLLIEISLDRPLRGSLIEPALSGVRLRGLDLDRSPGVIRLYVDELPDGESEGEAFWSFRLADANGLETGTIAGRCLVIRPKTR